MDLNKFKDNITNTTIFRAKKDISLASSIINKYKKDYPNKSFREICEIFENDMVNKSNTNYECIQELSGIPYQMLACKHLLSDEKTLQKIYSKYKNKEDLNFSDKSLFTYDIEKSSNLLVKSLLTIFRKQSAEREKQNSRPLPKEAEYKFLKSSLKVLPPALENIYKKDNIDILLFAKNFFSENDLLKEFVNDHNSQQTALWLEDLAYTLDYSEDNQKNLGVNNILSKDNLKKMSAQQLAVLNIFWQNKYAKKLTNTNVGYFILQQMDINNIKNELSDSIISNLLVKYRFLEFLSNKIYENTVSNNNLELTIKKFEKKFDYEYKKYFSNSLPYMKHDLHTDLEQCINLNLATKNIYAVKNNLIASTITILSDNKKIKNWGYINDSNDEYNTIQNGSKYILIGIDYPGLNKPVKIHVDREFLAESIFKSKLTNLIPIYEGNSDYDNNFSNLTTPLVLPFEKSHRDFLRTVDLAKKNFNTLILRHTAFLANPDKFPEHLKVTDKKGNKVRKRRYIDLFSGRTFVEEGKNIVPENKPVFSGLDEI